MFNLCKVSKPFDVWLSSLLDCYCPFSKSLLLYYLIKCNIFISVKYFYVGNLKT